MVFIYGALLLCAGPLLFFFLFNLHSLKKSRLIIKFSRSLGSLGPVVHTTLAEFKNAIITRRFIFLFKYLSTGCLAFLTFRLFRAAICCIYMLCIL